MELRRTEQGFALYRRKGLHRRVHPLPRPQGRTSLPPCASCPVAAEGYGSYLLKEVLRSFGGYDREAATVFTAPLPENAAELAFWGKFGFAAEDGQLVRRRTPDLTAVKFARTFCRPAGAPAAVRGCHLRQRRRHRLFVRADRPAGRVLAFDVQPEAIRSTRTRLERHVRLPVQPYLRQPRRPITVCAARHCRCSHVQLRLAAGGRPRGIFHRAEQHPRLAGGAAGGAPRRHRRAPSCTAGRSSARTKNRRCCVFCGHFH